MAKALVFDTGPLISLAMNNLLWILHPLKERFAGEFYITSSVKRECIERPLTSKKFKFEALQILQLLQQGVLRVFDHKDLNHKTQELLRLSNSLFEVHDHYIKNVQHAEIQALIAAKLLDAEAVVVDEFITRMLIEHAVSVKKRMERKLRSTVHIDKRNMNTFKDAVHGITVIRSFELVTIAFELGLFKEYYLDIPSPKKTLLEGLLWAIKLNGCAVSENEIQEVLKAEIK